MSSSMRGPSHRPFIGLLELRRLRLGCGGVDLRFERGRANQLNVHVLKTRGRVDVEVF